MVAPSFLAVLFAIIVVVFRFSWALRWPARSRHRTVIALIDGSALSSASESFIKAPYPTTSRLAFGFALFLAVVVARYTGLAINRSCAGLEWTRDLWLQNLRALPQHISILWFVWVPLGATVAVLFAAITRNVRRSALLTAIGAAVPPIVFVLITAVLGTGACPIPNF